MNEITWYLVEYFIAVPILASLWLLWGRKKRRWGNASMVLGTLSLIFTGYVYAQTNYATADSAWVKSTLQNKSLNECQRKAVRSAKVEKMTIAKFAQLRNQANCGS